MAKTFFSSSKMMFLVSGSVSVMMTTFSAGERSPQWNSAGQKHDVVLYPLGWASLESESLLMHLFGSQSAIGCLHDAGQVS